jgi:hypothetical protein
MSATNAMAFSSEVDTGSREENASKQESRAAVLIQSEPIMLEWDKPPEHLRGLFGSHEAGYVRQPFRRPGLPNTNGSSSLAHSDGQFVLFLFGQNPKHFHADVAFLR